MTSFIGLGIAILILAGMVGLFLYVLPMTNLKGG